MVLNTQNLIQSKASTQEKQCKIQQQTGKIHHTPIVNQKGIQTKVVEALIILISTSNKTNTRKLRNLRGKKDRECPKQLYEAIIPI
jgi:hypothetical protein